MRRKNSSIDQSIFSLEEPRVDLSALPDSSGVWMTLMAVWPSSFFDLLGSGALGGLSGKTSPVCCQHMEDGILAPSSARWKNSGMGGPTECWTLDISESRRDAVESSLSRILETGDLPPQYFLSTQTAWEILRVVCKTGRKLHPTLRLAMEEQVRSSPAVAKPPGACSRAGR